MRSCERIGTLDVNVYLIYIPNLLPANVLLHIITIKSNHKLEQKLKIKYDNIEINVKMAHKKLLDKINSPRTSQFRLTMANQLANNKAALEKARDKTKALISGRKTRGYHRARKAAACKNFQPVKKFYFENFKYSQLK